MELPADVRFSFADWIYGIVDRVVCCWYVRGCSSPFEAIVLAPRRWKCDFALEHRATKVW